MSSINDLLGISKKEVKENVSSNQNDKPFSLNLSSNKKIEKAEPAGVVHSNNDTKSAFAGLAGALSGVKGTTIILDECIPEGVLTEKPEPQEQFQNPTLSDIEKFVFEEQPDQSTEEITQMFSGMIDELSLATGEAVPKNVARCLKFIKEHAFLADILKPEAIGILVNGLRKSYGFIVQHKTATSKKKAVRAEKLDSVLDSLGGFTI